MHGAEMVEYVNERTVRSGRMRDKPKTERRPLTVIFLSFGLLCVLQVILNVSLRLTSQTGEEKSSVLDCNTTQSRKESELQKDCEPSKTECNHFKERLNDLQENFNALTRQRDQLRDRISRLTNEKRKVEEERDRLKKELREREASIVPSAPAGCAFGQQCPANWMEINSRCYFLSKESKTWQDSRKDCKSRDADLVIINSKEEQSNLYRLENDQYLLFWIGLYDRKSSETFTWVDGSALAETFWTVGQPDHGGPNNVEDCVEMYHHDPVLANWNDAPCNRPRRWLCERDLCPYAPSVN